MVWPGSTNRESRRVADKLGFVEAGNVRLAEEPGKVRCGQRSAGHEIRSRQGSYSFNVGRRGIDWTSLIKQDYWPAICSIDSGQDS